MKYLFILLFISISFLSCKKDKTIPPIDQIVVYQNDLKTYNSGWYCDSASNHVSSFANGAYAINLNAPGFYFTLAPFSTLHYPYTVQTDITMHVEYPNSVGGVGMIFNYVDKFTFSAVYIYNVGTYCILNYRNGVPSEVVPLTASSAIKQGNEKHNTIKIVQSENAMELKINNISITTADIPLPEPIVNVGVFVEAVADLSIGSPVTGYFNNFFIARN